MSKILALDPGTNESGWVLYGGGKIFRSGIAPNENFSEIIVRMAELWGANHMAIEMMASQGMAVGKEVFRTVWWTGRFAEIWLNSTGNLPMEIFRQDVKLHLCGSVRAKDKNIRQSLIDLVGTQGTKKNPGPTYGISSHIWSALAVAIVADYQINNSLTAEEK